jgi:hypothetical protein
VPTELPADRCQSPSLAVIQAQPPTAMEFASDANLLLQEIDLRSLLLVHPTDGREQQHPHRHCQHRDRLAFQNRAGSSADMLSTKRSTP